MCAFCVSDLVSFRKNLFCRVPKEKGERRNKWIEQIQTHQPYNVNNVFDLICELHFEKDSVKMCKMGEDVYPTIFPKM